VGCGDGVRIAGHTHLPHGLHEHRNLGKKANTFARMRITVSSFPPGSMWIPGTIRKHIYIGFFEFFQLPKFPKFPEGDDEWSSAGMHGLDGVGSLGSQLFP